MHRTWGDYEREPLRQARVVEPPAHAVLELQRQAGNQAVARMLQVARQPAFGTTSAETWATEVRAGRNKALYAEIATMVGTAGLSDIKGTTEKDINGALRASGPDLKPGLNYGEARQPRPERLPARRQVQRGDAADARRAATPGGGRAREQGGSSPTTRRSRSTSTGTSSSTACTTAWRSTGSSAGATTRRRPACRS
jgi:hypothetical protein